MAKHGSVWMTRKEKHDLKETLRFVRAIDAGKAAAFKDYVPPMKNGWPVYSAIATMDRAEAEAARVEIADLFRAGQVAALPEDARTVVLRSLELAPVIARWREARAIDSPTVRAPLAPVVELHPARAAARELLAAVDDAFAREERTQVACMGCFWPELPHGCGKRGAA